MRSKLLARFGVYNAKLTSTRQYYLVGSTQLIFKNSYPNAVKLNFTIEFRYDL